MESSVEEGINLLSHTEPCSRVRVFTRTFAEGEKWGQDEDFALLRRVPTANREQGLDWKGEAGAEALRSTYQSLLESTFKNRRLRVERKDNDGNNPPGQPRRSKIKQAYSRSG